MEGAQVKLPLVDLHKALAEGSKAVKALVKKGMEEMAERHELDAGDVLPLLDDVVAKVQEETAKFNPKMPYPPLVTNNMSIQIVLPVKGKVGVVEFNQVVVV